jgi:hypothetical protein
MEPITTAAASGAGEPPRPLGVAATSIWRCLRATGVEGYLSGLDALGTWAVRGDCGPHLVVTTPDDRDRTADALTACGLVVALGREEVAAADAARLVRLAIRRALPERTARALAPPEVAWVDLFRATRRGIADVPAHRVRELLGELCADPALERRLRAVLLDDLRVDLEELLPERVALAAR